MGPERLNALFNGGVQDICRFYDSFSGPEDLAEFAEWRSARADGVSVKVQGHPEKPPTAVAVVLTPGLDDPYARTTRRFYSRIPTVFATGRGPFFNEPRYWNEGVAAALEMKPDWVILSTDDLHRVDDLGVLLAALREIDPDETDAVWVDPRPDYYHSYEAWLAPRLSVEWAYRSLRGGLHSKLASYSKKFGVELTVLPERPISSPRSYQLYHSLLPPFLYRRKTVRFRMTSDFAVVSARYIESLPSSKLFNELFQRHADVDLSLRLRKARTTSIGFRIGSSVGGHYPPGMLKALKEIIDLSLLNRMVRRGDYALA